MSSSYSADDDIQNQVKEIREEAHKRRIIATEQYQKFAAMADRIKEEEKESPDYEFKREVAEGVSTLQFDMTTVWLDIETLAAAYYGNAKTTRMLATILLKLLVTVNPELIEYARTLIKENNEFLKSLLEE
jgi:hypothetical protein